MIKSCAGYNNLKRADFSFSCFKIFISNITFYYYTDKKVSNKAFNECQFCRLLFWVILKVKYGYVLIIFFN